MTESAEQPLDELDEEILEELAAIFDALDPVPARLAERSVFALSLAAMDAELATLKESSELVHRGLGTTDSITFTSSSLQLMVSTSDDEGDTLRIDGWITGGGLLVELVQGSSSTQVTSDEHGRLVWRRIPHGPVRFILHPSTPDGRPILTPVIEL